MWTALLWKELRECSLYAGFGLLVIVQQISEAMNVPLIRLNRGPISPEIPLLSGDREWIFTIVIALVAMICGFHQTFWESFRQTTLFLLHRPVPRSQIFLGKLAAGVLILLGVGGLPLLVYCLWAAYPGTHASPFEWSMSEPWWRSILLGITCYLGAFFSGLRPARWMGSRLLPLLSVLFLAAFAGYSGLAVWWVYPMLFLLAAGSLFLILDEAQLREYP